ncbi:hypothetical protein DERF_010044 [Dermatophagoides farinae]|nr:hypothetical protein DERF_010044 [Dermatophagoides farinae]
MLPTIHENPLLEDFDAIDDTEDNGSSVFQMEPIRLRFTDESSHCSSSGGGGGVGDGDIDNIDIDKVSKISVINSSICNLDHLFGSETISFTRNDSMKKSINHNRHQSSRHYIIRCDMNDKFIDEIIGDISNESFVTIIGGSNSSGQESIPFQNKPERGRGRRHRYQLDRPISGSVHFDSDEWTTTLEHIFRTPKKANQSSESVLDDDDFHVGCWDEWFGGGGGNNDDKNNDRPLSSTIKKSSSIIEFDDWNLGKLFQESTAKRNRKIQSSSSVYKQQLKNDRQAKNKRRYRRHCKQIDFDYYDDWSLDKLYSNYNDDCHMMMKSDKLLAQKSQSDDNISIDSLCLDSGIGSFESHSSPINHRNDDDHENGIERRESFSMAKEFWQQFCDDRAKKSDKSAKDPPSPTIKAFRSLPEPIVQQQQQQQRPQKQQQVKEFVFKKNSNNRYELLSNLKRAKIGKCYEYLNEFELVMRKYFPELEQQEDVGPLLKLVMHGMPSELYWLDYWIRSNFGCKCDRNTISRSMIDFDQLKAIILNEEQAYLCRKFNNKQSSDDPQSSMDQIRSIRSCPIPESSATVTKKMKNINFQLQSSKHNNHVVVQSLNDNNTINAQKQRQRRWSISIDRHMELYGHLVDGDHNRGWLYTL